jgi:O-antigen/teichoic acid export membrane protein
VGQLRQLASQTVIYGASSVLGRVLNYFLVPLYTAVFSSGQYGVVTELYAYVAFLNVLYTYGLETAYFRFATKSNEPKEFFSRAQGSILLSSILLSGLLVIFSTDIASLLDYPDQANFIRWMAYLLGIDAIVAIPFARLRLESRARTFAMLKLSNIGLNIGFNLFFLIFCPSWIVINPNSWVNTIYNPEIGVGYVFLSNLLANGMLVIFFAPWIFRVHFKFDATWTAMLVYAAPLLVMGFAGVTNEMLSRVILKYWLPTDFYPVYSNLEILGIFGACYKLSVFMTLAIQAFRYAFEPFFFSKANDKNSPELFAKVMHGFIIFGSFSWLVISISLPDLAPIFLRRSEYLFALDIVPWLLGGGLFLGIFFNLSVWYKLTDKTGFGAWMAILGSIITVGLNLLLIPVFGFMGSAYTTFITYFVMAVVSFYFGQRHFYVPYKIGKGIFYICLTSLSIFVFYSLPLQEFRYHIGFGLITIFIGLSWFLDFRVKTSK